MRLRASACVGRKAYDMARLEAIFSFLLLYTLPPPLFVVVVVVVVVVVFASRRCHCLSFSSP